MSVVVWNTITVQIGSQTFPTEFISVVDRNLIFRQYRPQLFLGIKSRDTHSICSITVV